MARTFYGTTSQEKAIALAAHSETWSRGTARTARGELVAINLFASESQPGVVYLTRVDGAGCTCPGAQKSRSGVCCHMRACALVTERVRSAAVKAKARYDELMDRFEYGTVPAF